MANARRESWVWLVALFSLANMIESGFWNQMNVFTPLYLPQLGVPDVQVNGWIGVIGVMTSLIGLPLLPFWGALADRYARQPVIVRSFVAHLLAGVLGLLAQNVWVFILARTMGSFALGNTGLMMTTLSERTSPRRMGLAFGIMSGAGPLGAFLGPLIGGPVVDRWGFRTLLGIDALVMVGVILAMSFGYRDHFV